jgi:hypothetical protein
MGSAGRAERLATTRRPCTRAAPLWIYLTRAGGAGFTPRRQAATCWQGMDRPRRRGRERQRRARRPGSREGDGLPLALSRYLDRAPRHADGNRHRLGIFDAVAAPGDMNGDTRPDVVAARQDRHPAGRSSTSSRDGRRLAFPDGVAMIALLVSLWRVSRPPGDVVAATAMAPWRPRSDDSRARAGRTGRPRDSPSSPGRRFRFSLPWLPPGFVRAVLGSGRSR